MRHRFLRFGKPPRERAAGGGDACSDKEIRLLPQSRLRPRECLVVTTRHEVTECDGDLHGIHLGILRAETHGAGGVLDRGLRLAKPGFRQGAELPCPCQVRIERQTLIDKRSSVIKVANDEN